MNSETTIHVIDDDDAVRESLAFLLETADLNVRTYDSAVSFLEQTPSIAPGCIITDVRMPGMSGLELVRALSARGVAIPIVVVTGHGDIPLAVEAMREGIVDFIEKPFGDETILKAVRHALELGRDQRQAAQQKSAVLERLARLSARERDVLQGLVEGKSNKEIAIAHGISHRTVEVYRANLMTKMDAASLSELVRMALLAQ
jgi:two-component system response regulator FixJ